MFAHIRRWYMGRMYRPGRLISRFLAPDVRRDVEVVDASAIEAGQLTVRMRTWNILYVIKGLSPEPPFGDVQTVEIEKLWAWPGEPCGGPAPEADDLAAHTTASRRQP